VVISDVTRQGVYDAGFRDAAHLRRTGYRGPIFFYTDIIGPSGEERTRGVAPASITASGSELVDWLETLAAWIDLNEFETPGFFAQLPWLPDAPINQSRQTAHT
jgi:hypothetical protein